MTNEEIFSENIKIAYKIVQQYRNCEIEYEDLKQLCLIGLWKAVTTYENKKGALSTYAYMLIKTEIYNHLRKNKKYISNKHLSDNITDKLTIEDTLLNNEDKIKEIENKMYLDSLKDKEKQICKYLFQGYTQQQIANIVGISQSKVSRIKKKIIKGLKEI